MIKVSDYIIKRISEFGVSHIFMIPGGGAMHLNDSVGQNPQVNYICNHHEQASAIAAEGYYRASGKMAAVIVTSGPGGTNTLTGVMGQWTDSIPVIYLSGQVKQETTISSCIELGLRQLGDQEINIVDIVRPMTKYADTITSIKEVKRKLEKALHVAWAGRRGPVWLDVPLDIQGAMMDENDQEKEEVDPINNLASDEFITNVISALRLLSTASRPVLVAGHGIRLSGARDLFLELVSKLGIPVVTTFNGFDIISSDHPHFVGRIGTLGDRAGNFALQNADVLLTIGTRNNIRQVSYNWQAFGRAAKKIIVDIDPAELKKTTVIPDLAIVADAKHFLAELAKRLNAFKLPDWTFWQEWTQERKRKYPAVLEEYRNIESDVHPYVFSEELTKAMDSSSILVAGNGTACVSLFQAGCVKDGHRIFWNSGCASMGYDLPAAIGASFADRRRNVVCLTGDGSLQMNLQELENISFNKLPIKVFILNNNGYCSIRQTQSNYFNGRYVACDDSSGLSFPEVQKLANAFNIHYEKIESHDVLNTRLDTILDREGPVLCEVQLTLNYTFSPKLSSERKPDGRMISKPLEDMFPFLDREEFKSNMLIPILE